MADCKPMTPDQSIIGTPGQIRVGSNMLSKDPFSLGIEARFNHFPIRYVALQQCVKRGAVVMMLQVTQFVGNDVIYRLS